MAALLGQYEMGYLDEEAMFKLALKMSEADIPNQ